ncbi:uncharacterized protein LOC135199219 [Macrobrachium nipponense]|uniref:uncharacterized protein LOC135199219 n=1 Tax=Macrobrachium nipponense TaxID=159736 RepID=UPI0030C7B133
MRIFDLNWTDLLEAPDRVAGPVESERSSHCCKLSPITSVLIKGLAWKMTHLQYSSGIDEYPELLDLEGLQPTDLLPYTPSSLDDLCSACLTQNIPDYPDLSSFQGKPFTSWDGEDCIDWANFVCERRGIGCHEVDVTQFRRVTGPQLERFKIQHFSALVSDLYGAVFFEEFRALRKMSETKGRSKRRGDLPDSSDGGALGLLPPPEGDSSLRGDSFSSYSYDSWQLTEEEFRELDRYCPPEEDEEDDLTPGDDPYLLDNLVGLHLGSRSQGAGGPRVCASAGKEEENEEEPSANVHEKAKQCAKEKIKTKSRRGERKPKIWEFLVRLLVDPQTNPLLVQWQDEISGTFVLNQPSIIARLWGARAGNPELTYNNFARGLRYHYSTGAIELVPEHNFMYRCGPKALRFLEALRKLQLS